MINLFSSNYLARKPIEKAVQDFTCRFNKNHKVLDIGCGNKPYARYFTSEYIGLDPYPGTKADIVRNAWDSGLPDNSFDAVILNQSLEHIPDTIGTIREIERVLKPGGLVLVTVPQTMRNHGMPLTPEQAPINNFSSNTIRYWNADYWRFTKFGLVLLFKSFHIEKLEESNSYLTTLIQLWNYFLASLGLGILFTPLYFINNLFGIFFDWFCFGVGKITLPGAKKFDQLITRGLTLNIILIARKP
ncbi:MAG TPA: methyltransferase domain-containing protein [Patescibacteria group bacterium]|nr:methyltransferase domain-containing protein [Patescibacteria group bacterium]